MKSGTVAVTLVAFVAGAVASALLPQWTGQGLPTAQAQDAGKTTAAELKALRAEVENLKKTAPDQAHAMHDVDYHFTNLWFAAQQGNWPLAQFYLNETRSHLRWAVRIIPIRKDGAGNIIKLEDILEAVENTPLKQLENAITARDREKAAAAYEFTLASCYSCHKTTGKAYLRPRIPERPAAAIINFDPNATTPK